MEGQRSKAVLTKEKIRSARNSTYMLHKVFDVYMQVTTCMALKPPKTECMLSTLWKISK